MSLVTSALEYLASGISVTATDERKVATSKWKQYQRKAMTPDEARAAFRSANVRIAAVCGSISGHMEVLDFDEDHRSSDDTVTLESRWLALVEGEAPGLAARLVRHSTPSGGCHYIYRCTSPVPSGHALARRAGDGAGDSRVRVLIETRGEGNYILVPPSEGYNATAGSLLSLPTITTTERDTLHRCAVMLSTYEPPERAAGVGYAPSVYTGSSKRPGTDYAERADHEKLLTEYGWTKLHTYGQMQYWRRPGKTEGVSAGWNTTTRRLGVYSTSTEFDTVLASRTTYDAFGLYATLKFGSLPESERFRAASRELYRMGYGDRVERSDGTGSDAIRTDAVRAPVFWFTRDKTNKETGEVETEYAVSKEALINFLEASGFGKLWVGTDFVLIQVTTNIVREVSNVHIKDYCREYVMDAPEDLIPEHARRQVIAKLYEQAQGLFGDPLIEFLRAKVLRFVKDDASHANFFYSNCFVRVSAGGIERLGYDRMDGVIWERQKINRPYNEADTDAGQMMCFVELACSVRDASDGEWKVREDKYDAICSAFGYLLHRYKDPTITKAIIFCDETISDLPSGRTGKGLICKALAQFRNVLRIDARNFSFDKNFNFQSVGLDTDIIEYNDCVREFPFDRLFSIITDDMTVEKKNRDEFTIRFRDSPKFVLSTNYMIMGDGPSHRGRVFEIELSAYFSDAWTPLDEFRNRLFDDWDEAEWARFDDWALSCVQTYLQRKLVDYERTNIAKRKMLQAAGQDFLDFAEENIQAGVEIDKKELFEKFVELIGDKKLQLRTFNKWVIAFAGYKGWKYSSIAGNGRRRHWLENNEKLLT